MSTTLSISKSAWRSTAARIISRGGDYALSTTLITIYGDTWFFLFVALSSVLNVSVDYVLQKYWAFNHGLRKRKRFFKEAVLYAFIRAGLGAIGLGAVTFLYFYLEIPYAITALMVAIPLWFASYPITKWLFVGSSKGLPICFRLRWIAVRKRARS